MIANKIKINVVCRKFKNILKLSPLFWMDSLTLFRIIVKYCIMFKNRLLLLLVTPKFASFV